MTRFASLLSNNFDATLQQVGTNFRAAFWQVFSNFTTEDVALMWHLLLIQEPHRPCWPCPAGVSRVGIGCRRGVSYPPFMPREILNLFDVQPAFKKPCDVGVPQQMGRDVEVKASHHLGISGLSAEFRRIINRSSPYHVPQIGEVALRQRLAVFHVQDERASAGAFKPLQRVQKRWGYGEYL